MKLEKCLCGEDVKVYQNAPKGFWIACWNCKIRTLEMAGKDYAIETWNKFIKLAKGE